MKKNMGLAVLGFFTIIALIGAIVGPFLMLAATIQKYGWIAFLADGKSLSSLFAVVTMWSMPLYRVGLIMTIVGAIVCSILEAGLKKK